MSDRRIIQYIHPKWTDPKVWARIKRMLESLDRPKAAILE